ncbi:MAG: hypothetical protein ACXVAY_07075 [Mucilaginibacter sp.]
MDKLEILVICRHAEILQTVVRLVNNNPEWQATGVIADEEALSAFNQGQFKLVLFGSGIEKESETALYTAFKAHNPEIILVQHYGGGSGLLAAEIYEALRG